MPLRYALAVVLVALVACRPATPPTLPEAVSEPPRAGLAYYDATLDTASRRRNDRIESLQGNRNPFIDRPEWVGEVWQSSP